MLSERVAGFARVARFAAAAGEGAIVWEADVRDLLVRNLRAGAEEGRSLVRATVHDGAAEALPALLERLAESLSERPAPEGEVVLADHEAEALVADLDRAASLAAWVEDLRLGSNVTPFAVFEARRRFREPARAGETFH